jgi:hypothetical protein
VPAASDLERDRHRSADGIYRLECFRGGTGRRRGSARGVYRHHRRHRPCNRSIRQGHASLRRPAACRGHHPAHQYTRWIGHQHARDHCRYSRLACAGHRLRRAGLGPTPPVPEPISSMPPTWLPWRPEPIWEPPLPSRSATRSRPLLRNPKKRVRRVADSPHWRRKML